MPYETHPADRPRQCVFGGTMPMIFFLDRSATAISPSWVLRSK